MATRRNKWNEQEQGSKRRKFNQNSSKPAPAASNPNKNTKSTDTNRNSGKPAKQTKPAYYSKDNAKPVYTQKKTTVKAKPRVQYYSKKTGTPTAVKKKPAAKPQAPAYYSKDNARPVSALEHQKRMTTGNVKQTVGGVVKRAAQANAQAAKSKPAYRSRDYGKERIKRPGEMNVTDYAWQTKQQDQKAAHNLSNHQKARQMYVESGQAALQRDLAKLDMRSGADRRGKPAVDRLSIDYKTGKWYWDGKEMTQAEFDRQFPMGLADPTAREMAEKAGYTVNTRYFSTKEDERDKKQEIGWVARNLDKYAGMEADNVSDADEYDLLANRRKYDLAKAAGDKDAMARYHQANEDIRAKYGYSGGTAGDQVLRGDVSANEYAQLNDTGDAALSNARRRLVSARTPAERARIEKDIEWILANPDNQAREENKHQIRDLTKGAALSGVGNTAVMLREIGSMNKYAGADDAYNAVTQLWQRTAELYDQLATETDEKKREKIQKQIEWLENQANAMAAEQEKWAVDPNSPYFDQTVAERLGLPTSVQPTKWDEMAAEGDRLIAGAKEGMGAGEQFAADLYTNMVQMIPTTVAGMIPGVGGASVGAKLWNAARGATQAAALGQMSLSAGGARYRDLIERGVPSDQARTDALLATAIEMGTEAVPLHYMGKLVGGTQKIGKTIPGAIASSMALEGTEEGISYTANALWSWMRGYEEDRFDMGELGKSMLAGGIMGGLHAGLGVAVNRAVTHLTSQGREQDANRVQADMSDIDGIMEQSRQYEEMVRQGALSAEEGAAIQSQLQQDIVKKMQSIQDHVRTIDSYQNMADQGIISQDTADRARNTYGQELTGQDTIDRAGLERAVSQRLYQAALAANAINAESPAQAEARQTAERTGRVQDMYRKGQSVMGAYQADREAQLAREIREAQQTETEVPATSTASPVEQARRMGEDALEQARTALARTEAVQNAMPAQEARQTAANAANAMLSDLSGTMGEKGSQALMTMAGELNSTNAVRDFVRVYNQALMGNTGIEAPRSMTQAEFNRATEAGIADREAGFALDVLKSGKAAGRNKNAGVDWRDSYVRQMDKKTARTVDGLARALGVRVVFAEKGSILTAGGARANAEITGNVVRIEKGNPNPVRMLIGHELTHRMQDVSPESYRAFRDYAMSMPGSMEALEQTVSLYQEAGAFRAKDNVQQMAMDEVTADFAGSLLENSEQLREFIRRNYENRTMLETIRDFFRSIRDALPWREKAQADEAVRLLEEAIKGAEKRLAAQEKGNKDTASGGSEKKTHFSLSAPVEETDTLVALHNLNEAKMGKALDLGGFPMPSIAVTRKDIPHTNFGDISLVMSRDTIDPKKSRKNTVYSADAWTPTFPAIEYEADSKVEKRLRDKYYELYREYGGDVTRPLYSAGAVDAGDELNRWGGEARLIEHYRDDTAMMKLYLVDTGKPVPEPVMDERVERMSDGEIQLNNYIVDALGKDFFNDIYEYKKMEIGPARTEARRNWWSQNQERFNRAYAEFLASTVPNTSVDEALGWLAEEKPGKQLRFAEGIATFLERGPEKRTTTLNMAKTNEAIRKAADSDGYDKWLHGLFDGLEKSSGIYNNKDIFTPSGNRRTFKQTHYPVTLENIVKAMAGQNGGSTKNVSGFHGIKTLRAGTAKRFKSIKEMHELEGRLQHLTPEEAEKISDALSDRMTEIIGDIYDKSPHGSNDNYFMAMDSIGETLMEVAESGNYTIDNIVKIFGKYQYKVSNDLAQGIKELLFDTSQMPVNIFEAKPERAVRFDEVLAAVVPSDMDAGLRSRMEEAGMRLIDYERDNEQSRIDAVNSVEGARFSISPQTDADGLRRVWANAGQGHYIVGGDTFTLGGIFDNLTVNIPASAQDTLTVYEAPRSDGFVDGRYIIGDYTNAILDNGNFVTYDRENRRDTVMEAVKNEIAILGGEKEPGVFYRITNNKKEISLVKSGRMHNSGNHANGEEELGVSVWDRIIYFNKKYAYKVTGDVVAVGSDGEPVLDPKTMKVVGPIKPIEDLINDHLVAQEKGEQKFKEKYNWTDEQMYQALHGGFKKVYLEDIIDANAGRYSIGGVDNVVAFPQNRGRSDAQMDKTQLEAEINAAGLSLRSKDNNKNNLRIKGWIKENHPDLVDKVKFFNDKTTGTVTVREIQAVTDFERQEQARKQEMETRQADEQDRKMYGIVYGDDDLTDSGLIRSYENRDAVVAAVRDYLGEQDGISDVTVHKSGGMGSFATFYIEATNADDEKRTVRFSGHDSKYYGADVYLWNNSYSNVSDLLKDIRDAIVFGTGIRYSIGGVDNVVAFPQNGRRSDAGMDEARIKELRASIQDAEDKLEFADVDDLSEVEVKRLQSRLMKDRNELDRLIGKERSLARKTSIQDLLDNLDSYRRTDLESLAEQISNGAWDDYEELDDTDLRDGIREMLEERAADMSPLEAQAAKYGFNVRPPERYSIGTEGYDRARLMRENQELKEKLDYWRGQVKRSDRTKADPKEVKKLAKSLRTDYSTEMDAGEITQRLQAIYDGIGKDWSYDRAYEEAGKLARDMIEQASETDDYLYAQYEPMRKFFQDTALVVTPEMKRAIPDYGEWRKARFGKLRLQSGDQTNVDQVFQEAAQLWPEWFSEEVNANSLDQLERIAEVMDSIYTRDEVNPFGDDIAGPAGYLTTQIMDSFWDVPSIKKTFADRAEARLGREVARRLDMKERYENALQRVRENRDKKLKQQKEKYLGREKARSQRQKERELRAKILRHCKKLSTKLTTPTDTQHIPDGLQELVATALKSINLSSKNSKDTNRTKAFADLQKRYLEILSEGSSIVIDPDLLPNISDIIGFADTPIANLGMQDLETIWRAVRAIEASISTANKALGQAKFETISQPAFGIRDYLQGRKDRGDYRGPIKAFDKLMNFGMLTPEGFFSRLGKSGTDIFKMLRAAQDQHISIMQDAQKWANKLVKGWNIKRLEKETQTFDFDGQSVTLSKAQIMSLYELMKRQQAIDHIMVGGLRPETVKRGIKERTPSEPWHLTQDQVAEIVGSLSEAEVKLADEMQQYMEKVLAKLGNEASLAVYGYRKFTEKHYFPIAVDKNETVSDVKNDAVSGTIAGWGSARPVKPNARNALIVRSVFDVFADHTTEMANYAAWLGPMENFNRIFNFRYKNEAGDLEGGVKTMLERAFGKNGPAYWRQLQDDLNNGVHGRNDNPFQALIGAYKGSAIGANLRVIAQQPTAILRALDEINPADFIAGVALSKPGKYKNVVMKYAPIAVWKNWGYFTADTGRQMRNVLFNDDSGVQKLNNFLMQGAGTADSVAWTHIWNAVEVETRRKRKDLKPGSKAFYEAVAERFGDIIDHTQVVDGILQRSQIMRSPDNLTKMATSFMAEPTKVYNMMTGALYDARNATGAERSKAMRKLARTSVALLASFVANAAAQSLVDALRDDDKDEEYWEKFFQAFWGGEGDSRGEKIKDAILNGNVEAAFNPATYIPWAKDIVSLTQGFNVSRMDMDTISRVMKEIGNTMRAMNGEGKLTKQNAILRLSVEMARFLGIPAANLKRDIMSGMWTINNETHNYRQLHEMEKFLYDPTASNNQKEFVKILFAAQQAGDQEAYQYIRQDLIDSGIPEDKLGKKLSAMMKDEMNEGGKMEEQYSRVYDAYEEIMKVSPGYQGLDAEQQGKVQTSLSNYAKAKAIAEASGEEFTTDDNEMNAIQKAEAAGIDPVTWKSFRVYTASLKGTGKIKEPAEAWLKKNGITGAQYDYCMEHYN